MDGMVADTKRTIARTKVLLAEADRILAQKWPGLTGTPKTGDKYS
jgi:hypothetical protein